ncbi:uncharacterized protein I206_103375 [Kwoniella pini CBS 10737]|uniref:Uncharacterized protein n=1 Tax=Kwoniella pini CBS 10737 TaxID=1296096 RepID=A0AAJ8MMZ1_9TREE
MTVDHIHPFLKGNFAPVTEEYISHPCEIVQGEIPVEVLGGQYIRNGGNPVYPPEQGRHYHCVANTSVIWWGRGLGLIDDEDEVEAILEPPDQRLLATCESGPPLEVRLPELQTVGWDRLNDQGESLSDRRGRWEWWKRFGLSRVQEMFDAPHVRYSVIDRTGRHVVWKQGVDVGRAKMFRSAKLVYAAGAVDVPIVEKTFGENDVVRLQYYRFDMVGYNGGVCQSAQRITHNFPLTAIPFEFPTLPTHLGMTAARYVYGCTMQSGSFDERLGGAAKVDCIAKIDVLDLIRKGQRRGAGKNDQPVDSRSSAQIVQDWERGIVGPIELFTMPPGWYAQEPRFVPREAADSEDDGYLMTYEGALWPARSFRSRLSDQKSTGSGVTTPGSRSAAAQGRSLKTSALCIHPVRSPNVQRKIPN